MAAETKISDRQISCLYYSNNGTSPLGAGNVCQNTIDSQLGVFQRKPASFE